MDNLGFGLEMTLLGMGTVFALLLLLMLVLWLLGKLDRPQASIEPEPVQELTAEDVLLTEEPEHEPQPQVRILAEGLTDDQIAAISIAVLTHAAVRRREAAPVMRRYFPGSRMYASRWVTSGRTGQQMPWTRPTRPGNRS